VYSPNPTSHRRHTRYASFSSSECSQRRFLAPNSSGYSAQFFDTWDISPPLTMLSCSSSEGLCRTWEPLCLKCLTPRTTVEGTRCTVA
jgi:hypothetical protein